MICVRNREPGTGNRESGGQIPARLLHCGRQAIIFQTCNGGEQVGKLDGYRGLRVWQNSMDLAVLCYDVTKSFPAEERFGLQSQMRRAVVSIAANIAEGYARESRREFGRYLRISLGSLRELETLAMIGERVGLLTSRPVAQLLAQCEDIGRMLWGLKASIVRKAGSRIPDPGSRL